MKRRSVVWGLAGVLGLAGGRPVVAQLSAGFGPSARGVSIGATGWATTPQFSSSLRFDHPFGWLTLDDIVERRDGSTQPGPASLRSTMATPSIGGFRIVASAALERDRQLVPPGDRRSVSTSLSYRNAASGAWIGSSLDRFLTPGLVAGLWRQIGSTTTLSIGTTARRGTFGRAATIQTRSYFDSVYSDTTGWQYFQRSRTTGDSGSLARRIWAETEARVGWSLGRVALDGVVGWRPRIDSSRQAAWAQGFATIALARNVALSVGGGSVTSQLPFARSTGRFGSVSLRLTPAALVRPNAPPQITPVVGAFIVRRNEAGEYVARVRLPHARAVELAGDFNGWQPIRFEQVGGDAWEVVLPIGPGTYRMNIRVDGERWVAPPGTAAVDDEFNGRVGLVVVR